MNNYSENAVMLVLCDKNFKEDRVNDYHLPESLDGFREVATYLGIPLKKIIDQYNELHGSCGERMKFKHLSENEFNEVFSDAKPNLKDLIKFYSNTDNYILELTEYHSTNARRNMTNVVIGQIQNLNIKDVLDYGCGIGEDSIRLIESGINSTLCDIAGKTLDFAQWRLRNRDLPFSIVEINKEEDQYVLADKLFEAVLCFEVLMHVPNPEKTLRLLYSNLKEGGMLFLTHRFFGNYSLALKQNEHFHSKIDDIIREIGFILVDKITVWDGKDLYIYKKILLSR